MTIDEMPAGPELDALVAKALDPDCTVSMAAIGENDEDILAVWKWNGLRDWIPLPKFSTDIAAAWEVVEKLNRSKRRVALCFTRSLGWSVILPGPDDSTHSDTAPLAICRAALKAVTK